MKKSAQTVNGLSEAVELGGVPTAEVLNGPADGIAALASQSFALGAQRVLRSQIAAVHLGDDVKAVEDIQGVLAMTLDLSR